MQIKSFSLFLLVSLAFAEQLHLPWGMSVKVPRGYKKSVHTERSLIMYKGNKKLVIVYWRGKEYTLPLYKKAFLTKKFEEVGARGKVLYTKRWKREDALIFLLITKEKASFSKRRFILRAEIFPHRKDAQITVLFIHESEAEKEEGFSIIKSIKVY
jgi:hypothetical protein